MHTHVVSRFSLGRGSRPMSLILLVVTVAGMLTAQPAITQSSRDWEEINFASGSSVLTDGFPSLFRLADLLAKNASYRVKIVGNTDDLGPAEMNQQLGLDRANAVKDFLVNHRARASQIETSSRGKTNPEVTFGWDVNSARFINRRVVLTVTNDLGQVVGDTAAPALAEKAGIEVNMLADTQAKIQSLVAEIGQVKSQVAGQQAPPPSAQQPAPASTFHKPRGDYVPCLFDHDYDSFFRGQSIIEHSIRLEIDSASDLLFAGVTDQKVRKRNEELLVQALAAAPPAPKTQPQASTSASDEQLKRYKGTLRKAWSAGLIALPCNPQIDATCEARGEAIFDIVAQSLLTDTQSIGANALPLDVSCSQSILTWNEARDGYNRRMADTYLIYEVKVRNMNETKEFLIHDVQIAVDNNRFVGGRDKIVARGVALIGQDMSARNFTVRVLEAVGALGASISVPFTSRDFKNGVSVFTSGLVPGFKSVIPDHTIDQLVRFNDTSFSATNTYKIVVPKNGAATFVTYLPTKMFAPNYKSFTKEQLQELSDRSSVIVAGIHINEEGSDKGVISSLSCPPTNDTTLDPGDKDTLTCTVKGDNLHTVSKLEIMHDTTSPQAEGKVSVSGQSSTGTVDFPANQLELLDSTDLKVYTMSNGELGDSGLKATIAPKITTIDQKTFKAGGTGCDNSGCAFQLTGSMLNAISAVALAKSADAKPVAQTIPDKSPDGKTRKGVFTLSEIKAAPADTYLLLMKINAEWKDTGQKVTIQQ